AGKGKDAPEAYVEVLGESLPLAPRAGEAFTAELLERVPAALEPTLRSMELEVIRRQPALVARGLFQAAPFNRQDLVEVVVAQFRRLLAGKNGSALFESINLIAGDCLRSLRKFGMRDEIHKLLTHMADILLGGKSLREVQSRHTKDWHETVTALVHVAA